jgi:hypothetical protein
VRRAVFLGSVVEDDVGVGDERLLVSAANPVERPVFVEGDAVTVRLPAVPVALVPV